MKRFFFIRITVGLFVAPIFSTVWIGGSFQTKTIVHPTCNILYEEKLHEAFNLTETEFLEILNSRGYFALTQPESAELPSLYLKKEGIVISIYRLFNNTEEKIYQSNDILLPYCMTS